MLLLSVCRTPRCILALVAAAVAALVLTGAAILGWLLPLALAAPVFAPCARSSCQEVKEFASTAGPVIVVPSEVAALSGVPGCPSCTKVISRNKSTVFILGTPQDVACKLFGGDACKSQ